MPKGEKDGMKASYFLFSFKFLLFLLCLCLVAAGLSVAAFRFGASDRPTQNEPQKKSFTVVLDAGHGGEDGGAVSAAGVFEKDLNLDVAKKVKELLEANGVTVVMTRETDTLLYDRNVDYHGRKKALDQAERRRIAETTADAVFVSIHMNAYPQTQYHGLQVWYSPNHAHSRQIAETVQDTVREHLQPENDRRVKASTSSIYLLHHLNCPAVLIECGFLSNPDEAARLSDDEYQRELAFLIFLSIMEAG